METIGAFQAKTQFSELLDRVEQGEEVTITRHGQVVAKLVPATEKYAARKAVIAQMIAEAEKAEHENPDRVLTTQEEIRAWRHEGHKY